VDYHLIAEGLVIFRNRIYLLDNSELKKFTLKGFHVKSYSVIWDIKRLIVVKKVYY